MNAIHTEWKNSRLGRPFGPPSVAQIGRASGRFGPLAATGHGARHDTAQLPPGGVYQSPGPDLADDGGRHWPRSFDEAFRTPEWRNPVDGPYSRPSPPRVALELVAAALVGLALVGVML